MSWLNLPNQTSDCQTPSGQIPRDEQLYCRRKT